MFLDYEPGDYVINPNNKDWGIGQGGPSHWRPTLAPFGVPLSWG